MTNDEMRKYDYVVECGIATVDELNLVSNIVPGDWTQIINDVIYVRTGYHTFEQWVECEEEDF